MEGIPLREVCELYHVSRRAVQGYEKAHMVTASGKNKYGHLLYDSDAQKRIFMIKQYQDMGFQIKEIQKIIDAPDEILKETLLQRKEALEQEAAHTQRMIEILDTMIQKL